MIEQNMYKHLRVDPKDSTSPAISLREQMPIKAKIAAWNEAIGNAVPQYKIANKIHNEKN